MYTPLYPPEGAPVSGFQCRTCKRVTRTERGIKSHCWLVHHIKPQLELFDGEAARLIQQRTGAGTASGDKGTAEGAELPLLRGEGDTIA